MMVKTKLTNPTKIRQHYGWVPKHGLWLEAGQSITIDGPIQAKRPRNRKDMARDMAEGRIIMIVEVDTEFGKSKATKRKAAAPAKKIENKTVEMGQSVVEEIIVPSSDDIEANVPGVEVIDPNDKEPVFDHRGKELPEEEEPVVINNINDIDPEDILANNAVIAIEGDVNVKADIPSKSAVKKLNAAKLRTLADSLGVTYADDATKATIVKSIDALR